MIRYSLTQEYQDSTGGRALYRGFFIYLDLVSLVSCQSAEQEVVNLLPQE